MHNVSKPVFVLLFVFSSILTRTKSLYQCSSGGVRSGGEGVSGGDVKHSPGWKSGHSDSRKLFPRVLFSCKTGSDCKAKAGEGCATIPCEENGVTMIIGPYCGDCSKKALAESYGGTMDGCGSGTLKVFGAIVLMAFALISRFGHLAVGSLKH